MAKFLNACLFNPTAGGTTDFTASAAVGGYMTPTAAGVQNGVVYRYRAESNDLTQWEIGYGTFNTGTGVLSRTVVLYNSLGTTAKINFTAAPNVGMGMPLNTDIFPFVSDTAPTDPADGALWWHSASGVLYIYYNDGNTSQWVGIVGDGNIAAVLYNAQTLSRAQQQQARANLGITAKNYIVNGGMQVSQENGTTAGTVSNYHPVDQFFVPFTHAGAQSAQQVASVTPGGSPNRIRVTCTTADASVGAGDFSGILQYIEGSRVADLKSGSASARVITIQFGVKAPAGTYCVAVRNSANVRAYIGEYVISGGEANTDVVKSVTLKLDTTGTWATDNTQGMSIFWPLMCGSTFQTPAGVWTAGNFLASANQFNLMGTVNNVFELFDVGIYEGSAAPSFQLPDFVTELLTCQRYWEKSYDYANAPGSTGGGLIGCEGFGVAGLTSATQQIVQTVKYKVRKRSTPTFQTYSYNTGASGKVVDAVAGADINATIDQQGETGTRVISTSTGAATSVSRYFQWTANARM